MSGASEGRVRPVHLIMLHILNTIDIDSVTKRYRASTRAKAIGRIYNYCSLWKEDAWQGGGRL